MNGQPKLTVVAALIELGGRLLVCQRRRDAAFALMWEFPGGKVEAGESLEVALARELREELGITATVGAEVYRTTHKYAEMPRTIELIFFRCTILSVLRAGSVTVLPDGSPPRPTAATRTPQNLAFEQIAWREPRDLPAMKFLPADRELIDLLAKGAISLPKS